MKQQHEGRSPQIDDISCSRDFQWLFSCVDINTYHTNLNNGDNQQYSSAYNNYRYKYHLWILLNKLLKISKN